MAAAILNAESFRRAVRSIIDDANAEGRGEDISRVVSHLEGSAPSEVSRLAALMFLLDQDYQLRVQEAVDAFRRWHSKKGTTVSDDEILAAMRAVYDEA